MGFSESSEKVLADADFRSFGIARDSVDFRSNITFSSFHLYAVLIKKLAQDSTVTARIYDVTGKQIRMIELGHVTAGELC